MSQFHVFAAAIEKRFMQLSKSELYTTSADNLFEVYLAAFPEGTNPIFRERTEHDCSCCKNFVRNIGGVVGISGNEIKTVWNVEGLSYPFDVVAKAMDEHVRAGTVDSIFRTREKRYGAKSSIEMGETTTTTWHHFFCDVPTTFQHREPAQVRGAAATNLGVFRRGMEEITKDALATVADLIDSNAIYRGAEFKGAVAAFKKLHDDYPKGGTKNQKDAFLWANVGNSIALFRNTVIGTLVTDISDGVDIDKAVRSFEAKVAPLNYKRPTAIITQKMIDEAAKKLADLGLESAVERRHAKLADISVNNVLFVDNSIRPKMKDGIAGILSASVKPVVVDIKHPVEISIEDFLETIVPKSSSMELLVDNKHLSNFMSLTAPVHADAGDLFKWDNNFAWSYDGDVTDSVKERVKAAGGKIEGALRVSLAWFNLDDLDLHVKQPKRPGCSNSIFFGDKNGWTGGTLDVDMNAFGVRSRAPVENIIWEKSPPDGDYFVQVNNYTKRETVDVGFEIQIEFGGQIHDLSYEKGVVAGTTVSVVQITIKDGAITLKVGGMMKHTARQVDKWGVKSQTLVAVNTMLASPNHWDDQTIGNKHWFFILKDCINPNPVRGIYNEFLRSSLEEHRKVFEALGAKTKAAPDPEQLSGIGFSSTRHDEAIVVVKGTGINKAFKIKF